jgi:iodotyrosine deiodinase
MPSEHGFPTVPHRAFDPGVDAAVAAENFLHTMQQRRSVRAFSDRPVGRDVIDRVIAAAATAPSGANKQPWRFIAVDCPALKKTIREAVESTEAQFYQRRASTRWLKDLEPLETDAHKPYLETAPWLIIICKVMRDDRPDATSSQVYYASESVGIAAGFLLAACQHAGLATLTHTPSPMGFLAEILGRPKYERPFLLVPVGYPADDCHVPMITRKPLDEVRIFKTASEGSD